VNNLTYQLEAQGAHIPLAAWEITVGPVAAYAPYGLSMFWLYRQLGLLTEADEAHFWSLPVRTDAHEQIDDRDDFIRDLLNRQMARFGYNPIGLDDAPFEVELLEGDYMAGQSYGWTEFEIDAATQALTVTTYGIAPYRAEDVEAQAQEVLARTPAVVSRFVVQATR
jgi:hypothetical protein